MFSQFNEDFHILEIVKRLSVPGRVLDIGAWDPKCFSNSRALIEAGWEAVLIEPSPGPLRALVAEYSQYHPRVSVVGASVAIETHPLTLAITDDAVSTSDPSNRETWREHAVWIGQMISPPITLQEIWNWFGRFDVVSIDVEGASVDLAIQYFKAGADPIAMIVEHDSRDIELMEVATAHGYSMRAKNGTNLVLERRA